MPRSFSVFVAASLAVVAAFGCGTGAEPADGDRGASEEGRVIENAYGKTRVPETPERVVTLDPTVLLDVLALGVMPVGYAGADASQPLFLRDDLEGVESIGTESQPNLEKIAALEPDLIMGYTQTPEKMSEIAPTVAVEYDETEWKRMFRFRADVLRKRGLAAEKVADFEARVREFREEMGDRLDEVTVSMIRFGESNVGVYPTSFSGSVLADIGVERPPNQAFDIGECCVDLSVEEIPEIDADYVFVAVDPGAEDQLARYESNPLWARLEGEKIEVSSAVWIQPSYTTAGMILDDLNEHVLGGGGS
jgi:iron complex transport system substrate-binding protein